MDPIRNHRKKTFIHLQISNANALQYTNPTFRTNANSYQTTQPINSIATNRGFSATEQRKQKFLFNITKIIHSDTLHSPKEHPSIFGVSPPPLPPFFLLRMNKAYHLDPSVQMAHTNLKLREVLLKDSIGIFDDIRIFCGRWPIRSCHDSKGRAYCSRKPAPPWASPGGSNKPEDWIVS